MNKHVQAAMKLVNTFKQTEEEKRKTYANKSLKELKTLLDSHPEEFKYMIQSESLNQYAVSKLPANAQYIDWKIYNTEKDLLDIYILYLTITKGEVFQWLPKDAKENEKVQIYAISARPDNIAYIENQTEALQILAAHKDPESILYCIKPRESLVVECISKKWQIIQFIKDQKEIYQLTAIEQSPMAYEVLQEPTEKAKEKFNELYGDIALEVFNSDKEKNENLMSYDSIPILRKFVEKELSSYDSNDNAPDSLLFFLNGYLFSYDTDIYSSETMFPHEGCKIRLMKDFVEMWRNGESMISQDIIVYMKYEDLEPYREKGKTVKLGNKDIYPYTVAKPFLINREFQARFYDNVLQVLGFDDIGDEEDIHEKYEYLEGTLAKNVKDRFAIKSYSAAYREFDSEELEYIYNDYALAHDCLDDMGEPWMLVYIRNNGDVVYISWYKYALRSAYCNIEFTEELLKEMEDTAKELMK